VARIAVFDRETPVARIVPFTHEATGGNPSAARAGGNTGAAERIAALARQGVVTPGDPQAIADWFEGHQPIARPAGTTSAVDMLLEMRREPRGEVLGYVRPVPLIVDEPATEDVRRLLADDRDVVVWMLTSVELLSTLGRLGRAAPGLADVLPESGLMRWTCSEDGRPSAMWRVCGGAPNGSSASIRSRLLTRCNSAPLLLASGDRPETLDFVTLDQPLGRCAQLEGFRVHPASRST
jgi:hypothetical protein